MPTFESVREKIETRYGTAIGATELAAETPEGRSVEEQYEERQRAAAERLEQIRKSMHSDEDEPSVVGFGGEDLGEEGVCQQAPPIAPERNLGPAVACPADSSTSAAPTVTAVGLPIMVPGG